MLENFNLFPQTRYFRCKRGYQLDNKWGGIASIFIICALLIILFFKLNEMIKMHTVFSSSTTTVNQEYPPIVLSTYPNDTVHTPFMMAFEKIWTSCSYNASVRVYNWTFDNLITGHKTQHKHEIALETCTPQHFSQIPGIQKNAERLKLHLWQCLPLNQRYEIQGSWQLSQTYKSIQVVGVCHQSCGFSDCGYIRVYQTNTKVNPDNSQPFEYYLEQYNLQLSQHTWRYYLNYLDQKNVHTDESLLPGQKKQRNQSAIGSNQNKLVASIPYNYTVYTELWFERSAITTLYNRRYLTLIDVISYVGGIFPSIIGIFFFMRYFGIFFYETTFAYLHFHQHSVRKNHFGSYLKNTIYGVLTKVGMDPDRWKLCKSQNQVIKTVNNMLDVNYLFRRIQYLQRAIQVILDEHQLKGIYLTKMNAKEANDHYKRHKIRDKVVKYLHKKCHLEMEEVKKQKDIQKPQMKEEINVQQMREINGVTSQAILNPKQYENVTKNKSQKKAKHKKPLQIENQQERQVQVIDPKSVLWQRYINLTNENLVVDMTDEQYNQEHLCQQVSRDVSNDFRRLFTEADNKNGDEISKRIVENINEWLRNELKLAIEQKIYEQNPVVQIQLMTSNLEPKKYD